MSWTPSPQQDKLSGGMVLPAARRSGTPCVSAWHDSPASGLDDGLDGRAPHSAVACSGTQSSKHAINGDFFATSRGQTTPPAGGCPKQRTLQNVSFSRPELPIVLRPRRDRLLAHGAHSELCRHP